MADNAPTLNDRRTKAAFDLYKELNYLRGGGNRQLAITDVGRLDVEKMKAHIVDCVVAVCEAQRVRVAQKQPLKLREDGEALSPEQQAVRNKVFAAALKEMTKHLTHDGAEHGDPVDPMVDKLLHAFPDSGKLEDGRSWLPMHWAVAIDRRDDDGNSEVTEADVRSMYEADPMALRQHHLVAVTDAEANRAELGYTPAHLLCGLDMTEKNMSLVRHFSLLDPRAFTMEAVTYSGYTHSFSALHVACMSPHRTEALLRLLVQLDPSQMKSITSQGGPLGLLCARSGNNPDTRLFQCLVDADSSVEVVFDAITTCYAQPSQSENLLRIVSKLLEVTPAAAQHKDEYDFNLAHHACTNSDRMTAAECIEVLKLVLARHKDALKEADFFRSPAAQLAAMNAPVQVLDFVLGECPEVAAAVDIALRNLLHIAVVGGPQEYRAAKARLLCARYPAMMIQRNRSGRTPLLLSCGDGHAAMTLLLCEAGGRDAASTAVLHPTYPQHVYNGRLPLHWLIESSAGTLKRCLISETADAFRLLLRLYPEAAGTEGGVGTENKFTPYKLAVAKGLPTYYRRLLLRAAPHLDPAELRRLNWAERRQAMFVAFAAVFKTPSLLVRLRAAENKDLLKHVVSFL